MSDRELLMADPPQEGPPATPDVASPPGEVRAIGLTILLLHVLAVAALAWLWHSARQDISILLVAFAAGCLGAFVHQATSFATFVGNRRLTSSWDWWYLLRVPVGGAVSILAYLVYAAGWLSPSEVALPKIAALGGLAGLFSRHFVDKLSDVLDSLFPSRSNAERKGKPDHLVPATLAIDEIRPPRVARGSSGPIVVVGRGFAQGVTVFVGDRPCKPVRATESELTVELAQDDTAEGDAVRIQVRNPDGAQSTPASVGVVARKAA